MDNNGTGGTPNPLNPSIDGIKPKSISSPANPLIPGAPAVKPVTSNVTSQAPTTNISTPATSPTTLAPNADPNSPILDPTGRPMEQVQVDAAAPKKKKTGLIVGIVIAAVLLLGGIITIAVVLANMNGDPVTLAMKKLMSGEAPANLALSGDIDFKINNDSFPFSRININLNSNIAVESKINESNATLSITDTNGKEYSTTFSEIYSANGDLFFKIEKSSALTKDTNFLELITGAKRGDDLEEVETEEATNDEVEVDVSEGELIEGDEGTEGDPFKPEEEVADSGDSSLLELNEGLGDSTDANASADVDVTELQENLISLVEKNDGVWIKISVNMLNEIKNQAASQNGTSCEIDILSSISKNTASIGNFYSQNPFIESTRDNIPVASKKNPIYKVSISSEKLANFMNAISSSEIAKSWSSCAGNKVNTSVSAHDLDETMRGLPTAYVEINDKYEFTRLYLDFSPTSSEVTLVVDLSFSYPVSVNVSEPTDYTDFTMIVQGLEKKETEGEPTEGQ